MSDPTRLDKGGLTKLWGKIKGLISSLQEQINGKADTNHGNHVPALQTADNKVFLRNDNTWQSVTPANIGAAASNHGNHVPTTQTASNKVFLRNDNTWQTVTPANIGAAASSHGNHVPALQTASNKVFLRNDNTWQTVTPANIGAAASSHGTHVSDSGWLSLSGSYGGASVTLYYRKICGIVTIVCYNNMGAYKDPGTSNIWTLPAGYRPKTIFIFGNDYWASGCMTFGCNTSGAIYKVAAQTNTSVVSFCCSFAAA